MFAPVANTRAPKTVAHEPLSGQDAHPTTIWRATQADMGSSRDF